MQEAMPRPQWVAGNRASAQRAEPSPAKAPTPSKGDNNQGLHELLFSKNQFSTGKHARRA